MDLFSIVFMYMNLGLEHILTGYDHLLFLLALIIVAERFGVILKIVTAFTIAHSLTLCLAALGMLPIYPKWIEAGIALTICYVAVENFYLKSFKWRWLLTFVFGLIHGMGFASSITEIGFNQAYLVSSLISFNVGIELGQLGIVAIVLPLLQRFRARSHLYTYFFRGMSACIFLAGAFWLAQRLGWV
jgi:hypothetical protein